MLSSIKWETDPKALMNIGVEKGNSIPKIIHFCWFGKKNYPKKIERCLASWSILKEYVFFRWDESNCSFNECEFVKKAYEEKKYAFVSDYYRLKALRDYGGIYLDTDVVINKSFDDLLKHKAFLNFLTDCSVGTAVIGSEKEGKLVSDILDLCDECIMLPEAEKQDQKDIVIKNGKMYAYGFPVNNYIFTYYILKNYSHFKLNNRFQNLIDFVIYPKEMFEIGSLRNRHYSIHLCAGEWITDKKQHSVREIVKNAIEKNGNLFRIIQIIIRKIRYIRMKKTIPFYPYYLAQKRGWKMPEL